jgi:hypothetical protein
MDFMFEDEVDEVGSDVEAYCPKCKGDTTHVVISKYEDEIRRVQCNPCGDVHSYRKPRGDVEDDVPEPIAAKKRAMMKKQTFDEFFAKHSDKNAKPYEFREHYHENIIVTHPKFGTGFISEILSDSKVEVTFRDSRRVLVHNRRDMPGLPLAAEGDGRPSDTKVVVKPAKGKKGEKPTEKTVEKSEKAEKAPEKAAKGEKHGEKHAEKPAAAEKDAEKVSEKNGKAAAKPADKAAAAAAAARSRVPAKTSPAAKGGAKRTTLPARPVRVASAKRSNAAAVKRSPKTAKRGKK